MIETPVPLHGQRNGDIECLRCVLDEIDYGILVLERHGVAHANRAARAHLCEPQCPLRLRERELCAGEASDDKLLRDALRAAFGQRLRRFITLGHNGRSLALAVVPIAGEDKETRVMVVMGKRALCPQLTTHWFCVAHRLTPAESTVLADLFDGRNPREIAQCNGVALSTVRTQIASIMGKTSTRRVRDLLLRAAALPPMSPVLGATVTPAARAAAPAGLHAACN